MATLPGDAKTLFAMTTSFLCPATRAPSGSSLGWASTVSLCRRKTGTVVIAGDGGMGEGVRLTAAFL